MRIFLLTLVILSTGYCQTTFNPRKFIEKKAIPSLCKIIKKDKFVTINEISLQDSICCETGLNSFVGMVQDISFIKLVDLWLSGSDSSIFESSKSKISIPPRLSKNKSSLKYTDFDVKICSPFIFDSLILVNFIFKRIDNAISYDVALIFNHKCALIKYKVKTINY